MANHGAGQALRIERSCALVAFALSSGRRTDARLVSGEARSFGLSAGRTIVHVPYPAVAPGWTLRTLTCGIALQCSPSKDRLASYPLQELTARELCALAIVEAQVALAWVAANWPGLRGELERILPGLQVSDPELDGRAMIERALELARSSEELRVDPLLGELPLGTQVAGGIMASLRRAYGRLPWSSRSFASRRFDSIPGGGGQGGERSTHLPPPSRPEDDDLELRVGERPGLPYPEWDLWTERFLPDHVAVLERKHTPRVGGARPTAARLRRWFEQHTHRAIKSRLQDGSDLDVDRYIEHYLDSLTGATAEPRVFRDLLPSSRDVTTALLLDGSSSLGVSQGQIFRLELGCADALCQAMTSARERHGVFLFSGNTRHRVDVTCLKDFKDSHFLVPSDQGLITGGYTRLGAPLRHLTNRLLEQPCERRLMIVIGDGLISDEGYEGRYAWADAAHAVEEADDAGVAAYYIGVGQVRVDPLPAVFGPRRSTRVTRVEELPRVLARVHRELVAC